MKRNNFRPMLIYFHCFFMRDKYLTSLTLISFRNSGIITFQSIKFLLPLLKQRTDIIYADRPIIRTCEEELIKTSRNRYFIFFICLNILRRKNLLLLISPSCFATFIIVSFVFEASISFHLLILTLRSGGAN